MDRVRAGGVPQNVNRSVAADADGGSVGIRPAVGARALAADPLPCLAAIQRPCESQVGGGAPDRVKAAVIRAGPPRLRIGIRRDRHIGAVVAEKPSLFG